MSPGHLLPCTPTTAAAEGPSERIALEVLEERFFHTASLNSRGGELACACDAAVRRADVVPVIALIVGETAGVDVVADTVDAGVNGTGVPVVTFHGQLAAPRCIRYGVGALVLAPWRASVHGASVIVLAVRVQVAAILVSHRRVLAAEA